MPDLLENEEAGRVSIVITDGKTGREEVDFVRLLGSPQ